MVALGMAEIRKDWPQAPWYQTDYCLIFRRALPLLKVWSGHYLFSIQQNHLLPQKAWFLLQHWYWTRTCLLLSQSQSLWFSSWNCYFSAPWMAHHLLQNLQTTRSQCLHSFPFPPPERFLRVDPRNLASCYYLHPFWKYASWFPLYPWANLDFCWGWCEYWWKLTLLLWVL